MKITTTLLCILCFCLIILSCNKQEKENETKIIPFTLENNRIIIEAIVNKKQGRFVFDTGSTESYLNIPTYNLLPIGYTKTQYKGKKHFALIHALREITFGNTTVKADSIVISNSDVLLNTVKSGYDGIFGIRVFEGYWCELSFTKKVIILHKNKPKYFTNYSPVKIFSKYNADFFIPITIDNQTVYLNIDTGLPFSIFFPDGLTHLMNIDNVRQVRSSEEIEYYHMIKTDIIQILDEEYKQKTILTNSYIAERSQNNLYDNAGLLGISYLKYYDWLFDYRTINKGKSAGLYYSSNTPVDKREYGFYSFVEGNYNFGILNYRITDKGLQILSILTDSLAYNDIGLRPRTIISHIDGKPFHTFKIKDLIDINTINKFNSLTILENNIEKQIVFRDQAYK
jgi:hypothetical protein